MRSVFPFFLAAWTFTGLLSAVEDQAPSGSYYGTFRELPITSITPEGWLAQFLERQRDGLGLHHDLSGYPFDTCLWAGKIPGEPKPDGRPSDKPANWDRYEQTGYLVDGLYRCGLLLRDVQLKQLGEENVRYVLDHPTPEGRLGPAEMNAVSSAAIMLPGPDTVILPQQWPFAIFTRALIAHYAATGDKNILEALTRHYLTLAPDFGRDTLGNVNNLEGMCWLYGQTGDPRIIALAEQTWNNFTQTHPKWKTEALAKGERMTGHGVWVTEDTKIPAILYLYTGKKEYLAAAVNAFTAFQRDHEMVNGVVSSDANLSGKEPDHEHETCVITSYSWALGFVLQASGDAKWADAIERCVLNAGPSVVDKEFKAAQYYASPNQMVATNTSMTPNTGVKYRELQAYRPEVSIQCCHGNVHRFLPNYVCRMWMSDAHGGIAAVLYGPSKVQTVAGSENVPITIHELTDYPFDGKITLKIEAGRPVKFPLYLRIPGWAEGTTLSVNGEPVAAKPVPGTFFKLERTFAAGDVVTVNLPMKVRMENPVANGVSLLRGPLLYALKIKVDAKVSSVKTKSTRKQDPNFPSWDLTPASPWNYALELKGPEDLDKVKVTAKPVDDFPWTLEGSPVALTVPARKVPAWVLSEGKTKDGTIVPANPPLPQPPLELAAETEQVTLVPEGATQLRVSVFPAMGTSGSPQNSPR